MQQITKICADSLRVYLKDKYDIKLQASHAHELVAAYLGYKSKASLIADAKYPISNLINADFIVFDMANIPYATQRYYEFGYSYPAGDELAEHFRWTIRKNESLAAKFQYSFREVAIEAARSKLNERLRMWHIAPNSIEWDIDGHLLYFGDNGEAQLEAWITYISDTGERLRDSTYNIRVPRVSANLGWGKPLIEETRYSGLAREMS